MQCDLSLHEDLDGEAVRNRLKVLKVESSSEFMSQEFTNYYGSKHVVRDFSISVELHCYGVAASMCRTL